MATIILHCRMPIAPPASITTGGEHKENARMASRIALLITTLAVVALSGCNTIAGAGKDIERGGQVIRDTAKDVQKKL